MFAGCLQVVRATLCGHNHALKISYRTAEASLGLQTEVEAHSRIWGALSERGHTPSPHLCLATFFVYSDVVVNGSSTLWVDGLAMPCVDGTLWHFWNRSSSSSAAFATGAAADSSVAGVKGALGPLTKPRDCLLYTSDAADE